MNEIWFTSDLHFGHNKDFIYFARGFSSIKEHDETIVENWNKIIKNNDIVYILGDLVFGEGIKYISMLNGKKYLILGNHDTINKCAYYFSANINPINNTNYTYSSIIKDGKWIFYLSHYPVCFSNYNEDYSKKWCLCGHIHTKNKWQDADKGNYHVEIDCHNNMPVSIEEIKEDIIKFNKLNIFEKLKVIQNS